MKYNEIFKTTQYCTVCDKWQGKEEAVTTVHKYSDFACKYAYFVEQQQHRFFIATLRKQRYSESFKGIVLRKNVWG